MIFISLLTLYIIIVTYIKYHLSLYSSASWIAAPVVIGVLLLLAIGSLVGICIYKWKTKRYSPSDSQQPGPLYEDISIHEKSRDIALEDNVAYGPVIPQQPAAMYEELSAQPGKIEMSGNVAYGQFIH